MFLVLPEFITNANSRSNFGNVGTLLKLASRCTFLEGISEILKIPYHGPVSNEQQSVQVINLLIC